MANKRKYINPAVIEGTMLALMQYQGEHTESVTPMADYVYGHKIEGDDRARFVRAAQRLHWNVVRSQGKIYENGRLVWSV
jgi:hypothetical protein